MTRYCDVDALYMELVKMKDFGELTAKKAIRVVKNAPTIDAIPIEWIEAQIEWLKSLDNAFSTLTAGQISAMVNRWKDEQDG